MDPVRFRSLIPTLIPRIVVLGAMAAIPTLTLPRTALSAGKTVVVRAVEATDDFKLRIYSRVFESENKISYPVTTMDREAFSLELGREGKQILKPESLATFGATSGGSGQSRSRRLVIAVPVATDVPPAFLKEFQQTIAENLPATRSEFFSLVSVTSAGVNELAATTPGESDNFRAFQRTLLDAKPSGTAAGIHEPVCFAADKFEEWARYAEKPGEQKALIALGSQSVSSRDELRRLEKCLARLGRQSVPVYLLSATAVSGGSVSAVETFEKPGILSGGFVQRVSSRVDLFPALLNALANLNEEYVATFNLYPLVGTWDGRNAIAVDGQSIFKLAVTYHGETVSTGALSVPVPQAWRDSLAQMDKSREPAEKLYRAILGLSPTERMVALCLAAVLLGTAVFLVRYLWLSLRLALRTVRCRTCGLRVKTSFSNCPYRDDNLVGWLSVLGGPGIGMVLPVRQGKNLIGSGSSCGIHLEGPKIKRKHAEMIVENGKAQLRLLHAADNRKSVDRVNGFPLSEPRLICSGDVLKLGTVHLRFEAKTGPG